MNTVPPAPHTRSEPSGRATTNGGTWAGFLLMAFCLVGLIGLFATYAAPLPFQRELRREDVLTELAATPSAARPALRDALGDSADAVLIGNGPIEPRIDAERRAMRTRFAAEAEGTARRLRWLIVLVTLTGAGFGAIALGLNRR